MYCLRRTLSDFTRFQDSKDSAIGIFDVDKRMLVFATNEHGEPSDNARIKSYFPTTLHEIGHMIYRLGFSDIQRRTAVTELQVLYQSGRLDSILDQIDLYMSELFPSLTIPKFSDFLDKTQWMRETAAEMWGVLLRSSLRETNLGDFKAYEKELERLLLCVSYVQAEEVFAGSFCSYCFQEIAGYDFLSSRAGMQTLIQNYSGAIRLDSIAHPGRRWVLDSNDCRQLIEGTVSKTNGSNQ
jgi:hypothetical protein